MSVERELVRLNNAVDQLKLECRLESQPITARRMDNLLARVRTAGLRLIDARIEAGVHGSRE